MEELRKQQEQILQNLATMSANLAHVYKTTDETKVKVDKIHDQVLVNVEGIKVLDKRVGKVETVAEDYKSTKSKGLGIMAAISAGMGGAAGYFLKLFGGE